MILKTNWTIWGSNLLVLLLVPFLANAGEKSVAAQAYEEELQYQLELIIDKLRYDEATDYDLFMLDKLKVRLNEMHTVEIYDAAFTSAVENREPTDDVDQVTKDCGSITFFTDIRNLNGSVITHIWLDNGEEVYRKSFEVRGDRWRIWSTKEVRKTEELQVLIYADDHLIGFATLEVI